LIGYLTSRQSIPEGNNMLINCSTLVPEHLAIEFQHTSAQWVTERSGRRSVEQTESVTPSGDSVLSLGRDPEMSQWTSEDLAWFVGRRNPQAVGTRALAFLVANVAVRMRGEEIATGIQLAAADDAKAREMVSGAFGWIGRDCYVRQLPLPFMFEDSTNEYWVTQRQAEALGEAGL
jgi:hypothetical protein